MQLYGASNSAGRRLGIHIKRGALVRIFAIAQFLLLHALAVPGMRESLTLTFGIDCTEILRYGAVVLGGVFEGGNSQTEAGRGADVALGVTQFSG